MNERLRLVLETLEAGYDRAHHYLCSTETLTGQGWIASGDQRNFSEIRTADGRRIDNNAFEHFERNGEDLWVSVTNFPAGQRFMSD